MAEKYVAPLKWDILAPLYDLLCSLSRLGVGFKKEIVAAAPLAGGERVLDIGCGSGTLLSVLQAAYPSVTAYGIDPDEAMLRQARTKLGEVGDRLLLGTAEALPFPDDSFDVCYSTLVFHHLYGSAKEAAAKEMYRVLRPGGLAIVVDFRQIAYPSLARLFVLERYEALRENFKGVLDQLLARQGFQELRHRDRARSFIRIRVLQKPAPSGIVARERSTIPSAAV